MTTVTDRPHELPMSVRRVTAIPGSPISLDGELASAPSTTPNAQLEVSTSLEHVEWKLTGAAAEVCARIRPLDSQTERPSAA